MGIRAREQTSKRQVSRQLGEPNDDDTPQPDTGLSRRDRRYFGGYARGPNLNQANGRHARLFACRTFSPALKPCTTPSGWAPTVPRAMPPPDP